MLCPNCGVDVGDKMSLCTNCQGNREEQNHSLAVDAQSETLRASLQPPRNLTLAYVSIGLGMLSLLAAALFHLTSASKSTTSSTTSPHTAELEALFANCQKGLQGGLKVGESVDKNQGDFAQGVGAVLRGMVVQSGTIEQSCEQSKKICEDDFYSSACFDTRLNSALFAALDKVCSGNDFKDMASASCQEAYTSCVGSSSLNSQACLNFLKRQGMTW